MTRHRVQSTRTRDQWAILTDKRDTHQVVYSDKANWDNDVLVQVVQESRSIDGKSTTDQLKSYTTTRYLHKVSGISSPVDTVGVVVPPGLVERVEIVDPDVTSPDEPVIGNHGSSDTTKQDPIGAEVVGESSRRGVEEPGVHTDTNDSGDVTTSSDVDVSWEKGSQVTSSRDRVGSDVEEKLDVDETTGDLTC